jgi:hypothetical protein
LKINLNNKEFFNVNSKYKLKKIAKKGMIVASMLAVLGSGLVGCDKKNNDSCDYISNDDFTSMSETINEDVSTDEINQMNIILNDDDCSDSLFSEVCDKLTEDGISFKTTKDEDSINVGNSTVITLDQQYNSGASTLIFAPYDNTRIGYSDSLALSMQAAFSQNGFFADNILCGKIGYREDENGNISSYVPTETEEAIDIDSDTSFVTISFGTENVNAEWVAKSIENGLARQKYYLDNYDSDYDLIYRANAGDSIDVVAGYFNSDSTTLNNYNKIKNSTLLDGQTVINPNVTSMEVFNKNSMFSIDDVKTRAY